MVQCMISSVQHVELVTVNSMSRESVHDYNWLHDSLLTGVDGVPPVRIFGQSLPAFRAIREVLLAGDTNRAFAYADPKGATECAEFIC